MQKTWIAACLIFCAQAAFAGDAPGRALDSKKYPQDTPEKAVASLIKALENRDFIYWLGWMLVPEDSIRISNKHGSLEKAAQANADPKLAPRIKDNCELMKTMLKENKTTQGEEKNVKWVRFHVNTSVLQMEKQADGRWCMNTRIATSKQASETPAAAEVPVTPAPGAKTEPAAP